MNNTDINELARQLRESAITDRECRARGDGPSDEWSDAATTENILLILDALEAAQKNSARWFNAFHKAVSVGARYEERIAELEASQPVVPEWISVSDRLPENEDYVLAADSYDKYLNNPPRQQVACFGDWFGDGEATWDDGDGNDLILNQVTHWMPLPAAPVLQEE